MTRGELTLALRLEPAADWALGIWLGLGAQLESYSAVRAGGGTVGIQDRDNVSLTGKGRLRAEWAPWPGYLALRCRADAELYGITRDSMALTASTVGTASATFLAEDAQQAELSGRLYVDLELARLFGFVPGVFAGNDFILRSSPTATTSSSTPVLGVGVRRSTF
jgi:hypothetical protein